MQRDYEVTFVLSTTLDEESSAATLERINQLIATGGGAVNEVHAWGRRRLAYPIQHQRDGFYITTRFSMPTQAVLAFENDLRLQEGILRHLIVRQDEIPLRPILPTASQSGAQAAPTTARQSEPDADDEVGDDADIAGIADIEEEDLVPAAEE